MKLYLLHPAVVHFPIALLVTGRGWGSPAQWGHEVLWAAWFVLLGAAVVWRAARSDVSWAFLAFYLGLVLLRVSWLGQRTAVFWHAMENGSLLLFAFFMISDPKTLPDSRSGRIALAASTALLAFTWQYGLFRTNGLFYALFALTPTAPLWDRLWPRAAYDWKAPQASMKPRFAAALTAPLLVG